MIIKEELGYSGRGRESSVVYHSCEHCHERFTTYACREYKMGKGVVFEMGMPKYCPFCGKEISCDRREYEGD